MNKRLISVEYLKAFSMIYIVAFWHLLDYTSFFNPTRYIVLTNITTIVLGIFVLISGFLLGNSNKSKMKYSSFLRKRFIRIYPLYVIAVIIFYIFNVNNYFVTIKSLFLISMFIGPAPFTLWFITMIMVFYLVTPLLLSIVGNKLKFWLFIFFILIFEVILFILFREIDLRVVFYFPFYCLGLYCSKYEVKTKIINFYLGVVGLAIGLFLNNIIVDSWTLTQFLKGPMILASSYIIFYIFLYNEGRFIKLSIISIISYSAFCMYLFHRPIYSFLINIYFPDEFYFQFLYLLVVCFPIIFIFSFLIQKIYDYMLIKINWN